MQTNGLKEHKLFHLRLTLCGGLVGKRADAGLCRLQRLAGRRNNVIDDSLFQAVVVSPAAVVIFY